jgi:HEAT repeat protein
VSGLAATFALLGRTENEAAVPLLVAALDAPAVAVRSAAVHGLLERRHPEGLRELVARVDTLDDEAVQAAADLHGRLVFTLREMLDAGDAETARLACRAAIRFREYDLIPTLVNLLEEPGGRRADEAAAALIELADELVKDLASIRDERRRRDPTLARNHALSALEQSASRYPQHGRHEPLVALVQLAARDNAALSRILSDPRNPCFAAVTEVLAASDRAGVLRLLVGLLDDPRPPTAALLALFGRKDRRTVEIVLKKIGVDPSPAVRANLRRVTSMAILDDDELFLDLDEAAQEAAVAAAHASGLKQDDLLRVLETLARRGRPAGRKAAVAAVADVRGARATALVLRSLSDDDPQVRAAALVQLRPRGVPGALAVLLGALDSDSPVVRDAARSQLPEYSFRRYLPAFEMLDETVRGTTGVLVAKIDPTAAEQLGDELRSSQNKRRLRALEVVAAMELVDELRADVEPCTADDEQAVRIEAARALGFAGGDWAERLLDKLSGDEAYAVREAAREAVERRAAGMFAESQLGGLTTEAGRRD